MGEENVHLYKERCPVYTCVTCVMFFFKEHKPGASCVYVCVCVCVWGGGGGYPDTNSFITPSLQLCFFQDNNEFHVANSM